MKKKRDEAPKAARVKKSTGSVHPAAETDDAFSEVEALDDEAVGGGEGALAAFTPEAEAVDARDVKPFSGGATLTLHNVRAGVAAVLAERAWFERDAQGPKVDFKRIEECAEAARALAFAARRAEQVVVQRPDLNAKFTRSAKLRRVLLKAADALVDGGVFLAAEVALIKAGRGWFDIAQDLVDIASLFRRHAAAVRGKTAVSAAQLREAATLGEELLALLTPMGARPKGERAEALTKATALRDRLAVVVARRYQEVERAAGWRWGRSLDEHVPSMLSRTRSKRVAEESDGGIARPPSPA